MNVGSHRRSDRRWRQLGIATLAAAALPCAALAAPSQQRTGTLVPKGESSSMVDNANVQLPLASKRGQRTPSRSEIDSARRTMRMFASCSMSSADTRREHAALVAYLRAPPGSPDARALAEKVTKSECLRFAGADYVTVRFDDALLRGEFFRLMYLDRLMSPPRERVAPGEIMPRPEKLSGGAAFYARLGDCLVQKRPNDTRAMVASEIASAEEDAAVRGMVSVISECVEQGISLNLGREMLQGVLSEALYWQSADAAHGAIAGIR